MEKSGREEPFEDVSVDFTNIWRSIYHSLHLIARRCCEISNAECIQIMAETEEDNVASQCVLKKTGFIPTGETGKEGPLSVREKM